MLTPLAIDPAHPFPQLLNKSLNVIVELDGEDLSTDIAVVQVPRILPRLVPFENKRTAMTTCFSAISFFTMSEACFTGCASKEHTSSA